MQYLVFTAIYVFCKLDSLFGAMIPCALTILVHWRISCAILCRLLVQSCAILCQSDISYPMFTDPRLSSFFSGYSGHIWLETKIVLEKTKHFNLEFLLKLLNFNLFIINIFKPDGTLSIYSHCQPGYTQDYGSASNSSVFFFMILMHVKIIWKSTQVALDQNYKQSSLSIKSLWQCDLVKLSSEIIHLTTGQSYIHQKVTKCT